MRECPTQVHIPIKNPGSIYIDILSLTIYVIRYAICGFLPVHCLDHILVALNEDTFFDLEGGSEGAILNGEFLSDD